MYSLLSLLTCYPGKAKSLQRSKVLAGPVFWRTDEPGWLRNVVFLRMDVCFQSLESQLLRVSVCFMCDQWRSLKSCRVCFLLRILMVTVWNYCVPSLTDRQLLCFTVFHLMSFPHRGSLWWLDEIIVSCFQNSPGPCLDGFPLHVLSALRMLMVIIWISCPTCMRVRQLFVFMVSTSCTFHIADPYCD